MLVGVGVILNDEVEMTECSVFTRSLLTTPSPMHVNKSKVKFYVRQIHIKRVTETVDEDGCLIYHTGCV